MRRILIVEDSATMRSMIASALEGLASPVKVEEARSGFEALRCLPRSSFDLIVTDIQMPRADGYDVCRAIKETRKTAHIPVIIVSALGGEVDIDKGFNAGANEYVTKPVDLAELSARIRTIFRGIVSRGRERVLVITPSQIERSLLEYGLSQQGFEVVAASSGEEAISAMKTRASKSARSPRRRKDCSSFGPDPR